MPPEIRPYFPRDLGRVLTIWERALRTSHPFLSEAFIAEERRNLPRIYLPAVETWVAGAGQIDGFVSLLGDEVAAIFVDPARHGQGIGRALLDMAHDRRGAVRVEVFEKNEKARRFYRKYGLRQFGRRTHEETGETLLQLCDR